MKKSETSQTAKLSVKWDETVFRKESESRSRRLGHTSTGGDRGDGGGSALGGVLGGSFSAFFLFRSFLSSGRVKSAECEPKVKL